ncbi:MAG: FAD-binding oxidoreductase [Acidimicrobiales bacterium]|nr:FAD-binding oxidoreductase [Acidimicrobiales bacterium]
MPVPSAVVLDDLRAALDDRAVLTGDAAEAFLLDQRQGRIAEQAVVVRPADVEGVAATVRICADHRVAIVPQGGNTGLSLGTQVPTDRPVVVLSLSRLNQIESVDPERWTITAQAGVTIEAVQQAARSVHRVFAPDWGARGTATVGGAISTDAGGNNVLRYGNTRANVMGIEAVLADGSIWDGRRALVKDSSGYDLKHLFIGGEGTLGIVTSAVLKLQPATPFETSFMAAITGLDALAPLVELAHIHAPGTITAFELVPNIAMDRVVEVFGVTKPIDAGTEYAILVKLAAAAPVDDQIAAFLEAAAKQTLIVDAIAAGTPEQEANLWAMRDHCSPTQCWIEYQKHGLKLDTAVPVDQIVTFIESMTSAAARIAPMAITYGFGHVGDGNIHLWVLPVSDDTIEPFLAVRDEMTAEADRLVFALGGTLSAEHGVGRLLRERVGPQKPAIEWALMRSIKQALDPDDLFNPGALLPPE